MFRRLPKPVALPVFCTLALVAAAIASAAIPNLFNFGDPTGAIATYQTYGALDTGNAFFQSLGTNGRTCATCHAVGAALSMSAADAQARFEATHGADPLFAGIDGANCPSVPRDDPDGHSLIRQNGLIRIALAIPAGAQFTVETVSDPYGCADVADPSTGVRTLSMYRRPLPATNLRFLSAVMFDGRDTVAPLGDPGSFDANLATDLRHQALGATLGHAQASKPPTEAQLASIVQFESNLYSAQSWDDEAGSLRSQGAMGGPLPLSRQEYYPGINDPLGGNPTGAAFDPRAFSIFESWANLPNAATRPGAGREAAIAAGEAIFNTAPLTITDVPGLNDALGQPAIAGTCTTCHDTPNVGNHSLPVPLDIGVSHSAIFESDPNVSAALAQLSVPDLPIFKVTCTAGQPGRTVYTSDPARALITGKCADLTRGKGPILRGLAARAPYFHNGAAATLRQVVEFYNARFHMNLTAIQKQQLVAFLEAL
ncbi:MAG: hypothetical protein ACM3SQ_03695 [Betaproteobacteria bacterium]